MPLNRASAQLETGIEESLGALRGWVSLDDPRFVEEWKEAWELQIRPALGDLRGLEAPISELMDKEALRQLYWALDELEESQWWISRVAQVPGNEPAAVVYEEQILPSERVIQQIIDDLQSRIHKHGPLYDPELMTLVVSLQQNFTAIQQEVEQVVYHALAPEMRTYRRTIETLQGQLRAVNDRYPQPVPRLFHLLERELNGYVILVAEAEQLRQSQGWNRAQHLMEHEAVPIAKEVTSIVNDLSGKAAEIMDKQVARTHRRIADFTRFSILLLVLTIVAAITVSRKRSRSLSSPLASLANAARAFANEELEEDVNTSGNYEMESLGSSFNSMRRQLGESRKALKEANESLEERVRSRTSDLQAAKDLLEENEKRLRLSASVFEHSVEGIVITDPEGIIVNVNSAFCDIHGYSCREIIGRNPRLLSSGHHDKDFFHAMWHSIAETGQWRGEIWNRRKDGSIFPLWLTINDVRDDAGELTHYIGTFSDISQIKKSQQQLDFLAHHDPLTKLPNRMLLLERLAHAIARAKREREQLAVIFLDLDRFKQINDSQGHPHGDLLLQKVAARLGREIRSDDTLARLGGDEFVLLLEGLSRPESAGLTAQKLVSSFEESFNIEGLEISVTASLDISIYPQDGTEPTVLLRNADAAMYSAKDLGRNNYQYYTRKLTEDALERVALENCLRRAIDNDELYLLYQPQIDLGSGGLIGVESLLRWQNQEFGLVSPTRFIPIAEETGLIHKIGDWVLDQACRQGKQWLDRGLDIGQVAVNISGAQIIRGQLVKSVTKALSDSKLPPEKLELEVTEGFILEDPDAAIRQLSILRDIGVTLSVDDFGTGYSSLSYLKRLPIQKLKIDQSFVRDILEDPDSMAIAGAVIAMGHSLGLSVIAEGVETNMQADYLASLGCTKAQGYLFSKPVTAAEVEELAQTDKIHPQEEH